MSPSRKVRRSLERRADKLLDTLKGAIIASPIKSSPKEHIIVLGDMKGSVVGPHIMRRRELRPVLLLAGLDVDVDDILAEIAASPYDDGHHYPSLVLVDQWCQVAFTEATLMQKGGAA